MIAQRKVFGSSDGYIIAIGNIEIAYNQYGGTHTLPICRPTHDLASNVVALTPAVGAFKVEGQDWVVSEAGWYGDLPHMHLVSKLCVPKHRLKREHFMSLFMQAYSDALIVESRRILYKLNKGDFKLC